METFINGFSFLFFMRSLLVVLIALIAISSANAINHDSECNNKGFDYALAKFVWNGEQFQEIYSLNEVIIKIQGNQEQINWNSNYNADSVIITELCAYQVLHGGYEGTASVINIGDNINSIIFCQDNSQNPEDEQEDENYSGEVPEFGIITIILVLITSLTFIIWRRK